MSRDQKPGKVRVIGQRDAGSPAPPLRRRTDRDPLAQPGTIEERGLALDGPPAPVASATASLIPVLLFLLCCAAGGVAFTLFILPTLPR